MATTAVVPTYVVDGSLVVAGAKLPKYVVGEFALAALKLPPYVVGSYTTAGIIPSYTLNALSFSLTPTGGVTVSGGASIVGDSIKPTGGTLISGAASASSIAVAYDPFYPRGGIVLAGGASTVTNLLSGPAVGGSAVVVFTPVSVYLVTTAGGSSVGGAAAIAEYIPYLPSGGLYIAGAAGVITTYAFTPAGGALMTGQAAAIAVFSVGTSGGMSMGGGAVTRDYYPLYTPSGGCNMTGAALSFFVPAGGVTTPENPYNNPFECWAVNYETSAASRYARLPANSICRFKGVTYVANAGGIYALDADTDAGVPIAASITLGTTDYGSKFNKRIQYVYLGFKSDLPMLLTTTTNKKTKTYSDVQPAGGGNRGSRAILGRGLNGLYWAFKLENKNGAYFELDNFRLETTISDRMGV